MSALANLPELAANPAFVQALVAGLAGIAAFASVLLFWTALVEPRRLERRIKAIARRREQLRHATSGAPAGHPLRANGVGMASAVVDRLRLFQSARSDRYAEKLAQAGWRGKDKLVLFLFAKLAGPIGAGVIAGFLLYGLEVGAFGAMPRLLAATAAVLLAAFAPEMVVKNKAQRRSQAIQKGLPDGLDLMVVCAEAGLSVDMAVERVGRELAGSCAELSDELSVLAAEMGFMPDRRRALDNFARRVPLAAARALVNTLVQTERYGTPLAKAMRVLAGELRAKRLTKAEEKAARLPAVLTVPMILFILPALFVVLMGPAVLQALDQLGGVM